MSSRLDCHSGIGYALKPAHSGSRHTPRIFFAQVPPTMSSPMFRSSSLLARFSLVFCLIAGSANFALADDSDAAITLEGARELYTAGDWEVAREAYKAAFEDAPENSILKAEASLELANLLWEQGENTAAEARVKDALARARALKLDAAIGQLLLTRGHIEASLGRLKTAENTLNTCVKEAAAQRDETFRALCSLNLRLVRTLQGKPAGSEAQYKRDVASIEANATPLAAGSSLAKTAELYQQNGDFARALQLLQQANQQFAAAGSVPAQARNRLRIASVLQDQGNYAEARTHLNGLVQQFTTMKNRPLLVNALGLVAKDAEQSGNSAAAAQHLERALQIANQTKSPQLIARGYLALCELAADTPQQVVAHCSKSAQLFQQTGIPALTARAKAAEARTHQAAGSFLEAQKLYVELIDIMEKGVEKSASDQQALAIQYANLCQVELNLASTGTHKRCRDALQALEKINAPNTAAMIAQTHYAIGIGAANNKTHKAALEHFEKAATAAEQLTPPNLALASEALLRLGAVQAGLKSERPNAAATFQRGITLTTNRPELLANRLQLRTQLAQIQLADQQHTQAATTLALVIEDANRANDSTTLAWAYSAQASAQLKLGQREQAIQSLKSGLPHAKKTGDTEMIELFESNLKSLNP